MKNVLIRWWAFAFVLALTFAWNLPPYRAAAVTVNVASNAVPEGHDFATLVLHDPWDMEQYSDISKYINESNVALHLSNIQVINGKFTATSVGSDAQFYTIFPGYLGGINAGKVGARYPISAGQYHCFFTLMSVGVSSDLRVFWFKDANLGVGLFGVTTSIPVAADQSRVYSRDLASSFDSLNGNTPWNGQTSWQGLRIDPTSSAGVNIMVDWVRLTDCTPVYTTLSWTGLSNTVEIWAGQNAKTPGFIIASGVSGASGSYILDVQGWEPGQYYLALKDSQGVFYWTENPLRIEPAPRVSFTKPSFSSGQSLNWEMSSPADINTNPNLTRCVQYTFTSDVMDLTTLPPNTLPSNCVVSGSSDPQIALTMYSNPVDTTIYRYLNMRIRTDGPWEDVNHGWMARILWETNSGAGHCINVSKDISFDTGWDNLVVDLADPFQGTAEYAATLSGICPNNRRWSDLPAINLRFDPNENLTTNSIHQQIDYLRLSRMDRVAKGSLFPVQFNLGGVYKYTADLTSYFTTDRNIPRQNIMILKGGVHSPSPNKVFLPLIRSEAADNFTLLWDTTNVPAGQYFICIDVSHGSRTVTSCSEAPVEVYNP